MIEDGEDRGPARFLLADTREEPLKDGWTRRYDLQRRLEFDGLSVAVQESIKTRDCDPKSPATPCEEHVAANEKRTLSFDYIVHLPKDTEAQTQLQEVIA